MRIVRSEKARSDLLQIYSYIAERSPKAAETLFSDINAKLINLARFPFIGRERSSLASGLRSVVVGSYVIFYTVELEQITIVRVLDGRMDIDEELRR